MTGSDDVRPDDPGASSGIGMAVPRREDLRLLRGQGSYTADVMPPGLAHAVLVRSPHGHAEIRGIELQSARAMPGVLAVLTAVTVVLAMKVVGLLLVAALIVIPAATGLQLALNFRMAMILSCLMGVLSVLGGLLSAYYMDLPASGSIVLLATAFFLISIAAAKSLGLRR